VPDVTDFFRSAHWAATASLVTGSGLSMPPLSRLALLATVTALALPAPAVAQVKLSEGVGTACGIELAPSLVTTPGGPICGTDGNDVADFSAEPAPISFFGETGADRVNGSAGNDVIRGGPGNDPIDGGPGDDVIDGGDDSDRVNGGEGNDLIIERRFGVRETFHGGPGNDVIAGGRGSDVIYGDEGDDVLMGGSGSDRLIGGEGDDILYGGPNRDEFDCGPGNDTVYRLRGVGPDRNSAGRQDATLFRKGCERIVNFDPTGDFALRDILGTNGPDTLVGGPRRDLLQGKGGSDRLFGGGGNDELEGDGATNQGDDLLMGGSGSDRLAGRSGNDKLYGDARSPDAGPPGSDELAGGRGRDLMVGGPGPDLILGAYDGDRILGGTGNDVINLLGGDTSNPNGQVAVDCGRGLDTVVVNPSRTRATYKRCEKVIRQFHEVDYGYLQRPSPESYPAAYQAQMQYGIALLDGRVPPPPPSPPAE